jgi:putative phosphoesterase
VRIGVISDTHGSLVAWQRALANCFPAADLILHAGDLLYHGPRNPIPEGYDPPALAEALNRSPAPLIVVRGNCDSDVDQLVLDWPIQAPYALVQQEGLRVMVSHGEEITSESGADLIGRYRLAVLVTGHTHHPRAERCGGGVWLNPGSTSLPKWEWHGEAVPTAAVIEDDVVRVCDVRTGEALIEQAVGE